MIREHNTITSVAYLKNGHPVQTYKKRCGNNDCLFPAPTVHRPYEYNNVLECVWHCSRSGGDDSVIFFFLRFFFFNFHARRDAHVSSRRRSKAYERPADTRDA
jgi:hypothetical protein